MVPRIMATHDAWVPMHAYNLKTENLSNTYQTPRCRQINWACSLSGKLHFLRPSWRQSLLTEHAVDIASERKRLGPLIFFETARERHLWLWVQFLEVRDLDDRWYRKISKGDSPGYRPRICIFYPTRVPVNFNNHKSSIQSASVNVMKGTTMVRVRSSWRVLRHPSIR